MIIVLPLALAAFAVAPDEFARQWPITLEGDDGAYRIELADDVYRHVRRGDLADLAAFDASGAPVPFGPIPVPRDAPPALVRTERALPWFRVPLEADASFEQVVEMHVERGPDGTLVPVLHTGTVVAAAPIEDVIVDASNASGGVDALELTIDPAATGALSLVVDVHASDDLVSWRRVASGQAIVSLEREGHRLERRRIELPAVDAEYLLIERVDAPGTVPVAGVTAHLAEYGQAAPSGPRRTLEPAAGAAADAGTFVYDTGGPFPIERARIALATPNSVVNARVESRDAPDAPWVERAAGTAFRVRAGGAEVANLADDIGPVRDRHWRVVTSPPVAEAPALVLDYRPDRYLILAQGTPPFGLAAGSYTARRPNYPLDALLAELGMRLGSGFVPAIATIGAGSDVAGAARTPPRAPFPWLRWTLWLVLVGGAAAIVAMVVRLLRERQPAE